MRNGAGTRPTRDGRKVRVPRKEQGKSAGRKRDPADFRRGGLEKAYIPLVIECAVEGEARCGGVEQPFLPFHHHLHVAETFVAFVEAAGKRARVSVATLTKPSASGCVPS